ncbi:MAG TPA: fructosamine kinase family protein [Ignavibacteriaceae bacterium]|nr:fructosamine kinase family protein [Ignavibacteriaceae bacterium]
MSFKNEIRTELNHRLGVNIIKTENLSGGCISNAFKISTEDGRDFFLKINDNVPTDMYKTEANGLYELQKSNAIRVPEAKIYSGRYIVTEFIKTGKKSIKFFQNFGRNFALLHRYKGYSFGFYEDNYIGSNPQKNLADDFEARNWNAFYLNKRLRFQLSLCEKNGYATNELKRDFTKLEDKISDIIIDTHEEPSLLHGDLWSGNYIIGENGEACIIDPAVYYGNREADLAMTKLFGGYPQQFYESYNEAYPLDDGWEYRENIYMLYHVLNHLNLFGRSYYSQVLSLIKYYL